MKSLLKIIVLLSLMIFVNSRAAAYRGMAIIDASTPPPWGSIEENNWYDMCDWVAGAAIVDTQQSAGHKHNVLWDTTLDTSVWVDGNYLKIRDTTFLQNLYMASSGDTVLMATATGLVYGITPVNLRTLMGAPSAAHGVTTNYLPYSATSTSWGTSDVRVVNDSVTGVNGVVALTGSIGDFPEALSYPFFATSNGTGASPWESEGDLIIAGSGALYASHDIHFVDVTDSQTIFTIDDGNYCQSWLEHRFDYNTASMAACFDANKNLISSATVSSTEQGYLDGVTSGIQGQIDSKVDTTDIIQTTVICTLKNGSSAIGTGTATLWKFRGQMTICIPTLSGTSDGSNANTIQFPDGTMPDLRASYHIVMVSDAGGNPESGVISVSTNVETTHSLGVELINGSLFASGATIIYACVIVSVYI